MKKNYQTFQAGNSLKTKVKRSFLGLAALCCINLTANAQAGAAFNVDGVDDYAVVPSNTDLQVGAGNFTVEFWAKPNLVNGAFHYVVTKDNTNSDLEFLVGLGSNNKWFCYTKNSSNYVGSISTATANTWYHVACTYDGTNQNLYVNGVFQGSVAVGATPHVNTESILIGARTASSPQQNFSGDIDEVRIWNYARTSCQINAYMNCEIAGFATGLVANYHFNQGVAAGTNAAITSLTDASGNSNNGTLMNTALTGSTSNWVTPGGVMSGSVTPAPSPCVIASALNFDSVDDQVVVPHNAALNLVNLYTFEAWVKPNGTGYRTIVGKGDGNGYPGTGEYIFQITGTGQLALFATISNGWKYSSAGAVTNGVWQHVAVTNNGSNVKFYVNGALVSTGTTVAGISNPGTNPFYIGRQGDGVPTNNLMNGDMDEVRVWNTARTQCEINTYMNSEIPGSFTGLIGNYHFNSGTPGGSNTSVTTLTDASGNTFDGTLTNFALTGSTSNWIAPSGVSNGYTTVPVLTPTVSVTSGAICNGNSFTMVPSGASTYTFSSGSAIVSPTTSTSYSVTGTNAQGCISNVAVSNVTVNTCMAISSGLNGDGVNDRVAIPHSSNLNIESAFTLECWFNTNIIAYETNLMEKGRWAGDWLFFIKPKSGQGTKICLASWSWGPVELWGTTDLQTGTWYHYAATWDGTTRKVYLNGVLEASDTPTGSLMPNTNELGLGAASGGTYEFSGTIDDARIWNVVRTPAQIAASYSVALTGNEPGLVAYYNFDDGATAYQNNTAITTVNDLTANNNDGVLTNYAKTGCTSNYICGAPVLGGTCTVPAILTPTLATVSGNCLVNLNLPTTTDACATVTFTGTTSSATTYTIAGTYTINWLFDDGAGTTTNATQTVVVNSPSLPTIAITEMPSTPLNVAFGGTANASSIYPSNPAADAFDGDTITTGWGSDGSGLPQWLEYDFGAGNAKVLIKYAFYCASTMQGGWGSAGYDPSVWTFEGYNGTTWDILDTRTDNAPMQDIWNVYTFTNTTAYQKYRMNVTQSTGMSYAMMTELRLYEAGSGPCNNKTFTSSINSFATPANYQWQVNGNNVGTNNPVLALPFFLVNDVVTCNINTANTCVTSSVATSNPLVLTTGAVANLTNTIICTGQSITVGSNTYSTTGVYITGTYTAASGCDSLTGINLTVNSCTGVNNIAGLNSGISVNPNPNNGLFTIEVPTVANVIVINAIGQVILTEKMEVGKHDLNIQDQATGIYFVKVIQDDKQYVIKLIKE